MSAKTTKMVEDGPNIVVSFHDSTKRALVKGRDLGDSRWLWCWWYPTFDYDDDVDDSDDDELDYVDDGDDDDG